MSKIKIYQLKQADSHLKELNAFETARVIGGYDDEETESSQEIIQKAMQEAVMRSDAYLNANRGNDK